MTEPLHRSVPATLERIDATTVATRIMPFGVTAAVADPLPDGTVDRYTEAFGDTAFNRQLTAAEKAGDARIFHRVNMIDEHHGSKLGFATVLRREPDGLYGSIRLLPSRVADVDALLEEGINGLSVEFLPLRGGTKYLPGNVRLRTDVHLIAVALTAANAYPGAEVLAMRDAEDAVAGAERDYEAQVAGLQGWLADAVAAQARWNERVTS